MRALRSFVPVLACACTLITAGPAMGADIQTSPGLPDLDVRTGHTRPDRGRSAPTRRRLRAEVAWNEFGTPSSLVRPGGALGATVGGATAPRRRPRLAGPQPLAVPPELDSRASRRSPTRGSPRATTHAITLRQTPGGVAASGGGLVTIGVTKAGSAWKVVSASSSISGDETLASDGTAQLPDGQAWQRRREQRRPQHVAGARHAASARASSASAAAGRACASPASATSSARVRSPSRPLRAATSRRSRPSCSTRPAVEPSAYRVFVDARSGAVLARENLVDSEGSTTPRPRPGRAPPRPRARTTPLTGALPPQDARLRHAEGPVHRRRRLRRPRDRRLRQRRQPGERHRPQALPRRRGRPGRRAGHGPHARAHPLRAGRAASRRATTSSRCASSSDGTAPVAPLAWTGTIGLDDLRPAAPFTARWRAFMANPPLAPLDAGPVEQPEHRHAREPLLEAEHDAVGLRPRRRQPRLALAVGLRPATNASTNTTTRQQRAHGRVLDRRQPARARPVPPGEPDPRLHVPVDQRVVHAGLQPGHALRRRVPGRQELRRLRGGDEPVRDAQPHARLLLPPRLHRGQLQRPAVATSA